MQQITYKRILVSIVLFVGLLVHNGCSQMGDQSTQTWEEWIKRASVQKYLQDMQEITVLAYERGLPIHKRFQEASGFDRENVAHLKQYGSVLHEKIKRLDPPDQLRAYHAKQVKMFEYGNMATNAIFNQDVESARLYTRKMIEAGIDTDEELKYVYTELHAPQEVLLALEEKIKNSRDALRRIADQQHPYVLPGQSAFE
ncbi:MAG: hypothetical protein JSW40_06680 [Candidatus Omnitrophota bacterium]|nr:MAG: hypothetical protein JSW40_06680 [Candidatus Omnitrophota bacterium]